MSPFNISEEEKNAIREQHKAAAKEIFDRKAAEKGGLKAPEKVKEESKKEEKKA